MRAERPALPFIISELEFTIPILLSGQLNNPAYPQFDLNFLNDQGVVVGGAISVGPNTTFGLTAKRIARWGGPQTIGVGSIVSGNSQTLQDNF